MARESRKVWAERVRRWRKSGLTAREFAAELGVNANTLAFWKYEIARNGRDCEAAGGASSRVEFVEVTGAVPEVASNATYGEPLEVVCAGGRTVRVPRSFDEQTLLRLLAALEGR